MATFELGLLVFGTLHLRDRRRRPQALGIRSSVGCRIVVGARTWRVIAAGDEARRRVVRDFHDDAQQRLVHSSRRRRTARFRLAADDRPRRPLHDSGMALDPSPR